LTKPYINHLIEVLDRVASEGSDMDVLTLSESPWKGHGWRVQWWLPRSEICWIATTEKAPHVGPAEAA
jgi:hypothetical protein